MPFAALAGITSASGSRWSNEYSGCDETIFTYPCSRASSTACSICSPVKFEQPTYRTLPASTISVIASSVSASGTSGSHAWHW